MKISYITGRQEISGVEYHRLFKPFSLFDEVQRLVGVHQDILDMGFDVIVFNRHLPTLDQKPFLDQLKRQGTRIICDLDDYWELYHGHIGQETWKHFRIKQRILEALEMSDEVWVTNEYLGKRVDRFNDNWYVMPNALDPNDEQWRPKKQYGNKIGWAGGATHYKDLKRIPFNRKPVICGYMEKDVAWSKILRLNPDAQYVKGLDVHNYGLNYELFDIAVAPLVNNEFNRCKSNLKILEAGLKGLPIFVEDIHPYVDDAPGVFRVNDWQAAIRKAEAMGVDDIRESGQALREYVIKNYNLHEVNRKRVSRIMEN